MVKFLILVVSAYLASNLIVGLYRRAVSSIKEVDQLKILSSIREKL
jgi:hypothetical protein